MNNELIPTTNLPVNPYASDKAFDEVASPGYLPRIQVCGANSEVVKESKINMGHWGLIRTKGSVEDLGKEFDAIPLCWRPKALRFSQKDNKVTTVHDINDPEFKVIQEESKVQNSGSMYGPEFLIWLPNLSMFVTCFLSSKSSRKEGANLRSLIGKVASFRVQLLKQSPYSWHSPQISSSITQVTNLPTKEQIDEANQKFSNVPGKQEEVAEEAPNEEERPR